MLIYSLILLAAFVIDLALAASRRGQQRRFELNAGLILIASFYSYTAALPVSRILLKTQPVQSSTDDEFMFNSLLAALGLTVGLFLCPQYGADAPRRSALWSSEGTRSRGSLRAGTMIAIVTITISGAFIYFWSNAQFSVDKLAGAYGVDNGITSENVTVLDTLLVPLAIAAMLHGLYAIRVRALKGPAVIAMNLLCVGLLFIFLLQGHRNLMIFLGLSALAIRLYGKPIQLTRFVVTGMLTLVAFYTIGIIRNWGWFQLNEVTFGDTAVDPLNGELGASYSVYEKLQETGVADSLQFGRTYVIDAAVNLIPQQLWRNRPPSPAVRFSRAYFQTDTLPSGLGFSPLVESMINFSTYGIPVVFALTAFVFVRLDQWARAYSRTGILISCILLPSIVNWNRIDFAACEKMFLVYCAFLWGLDKFFYSSAPANAPSALRLTPVAENGLLYVGGGLLLENERAPSV